MEECRGSKQVFRKKYLAFIRECSFCRCLTPDAEARPDIVEVSSLLSDVMMKYLDVLSTSHLMLEKKLDRERRRTQRYFMEANRNAVTQHHQLSILSQVSRCIRLYFFLSLFARSEKIRYNKAENKSKQPILLEQFSMQAL